MINPRICPNLWTGVIRIGGKGCSRRERWHTQTGLNVTWRNDLGYGWLAAAARSYRSLPRASAAKIGGPESLSGCTWCMFRVVSYPCCWAELSGRVGSDGMDDVSSGLG